MPRLNWKMIHAFNSSFFRMIIAVIAIFARVCFAQVDSVDVTFVYQSAGNPSSVYLPGEFNGWVIGSNLSAMTYNSVRGRWEKTVRLRKGGPSPLPDPGKSIPGAYQYKFLIRSIPVRILWITGIRIFLSMIPWFIICYPIRFRVWFKPGFLKYPLLFFLRSGRRSIREASKL